MKINNIFLTACAVLTYSCTSSVQIGEEVACQPKIYPDYASVTIPTNIAPLNFQIVEKGEKMKITISGKGSEIYELFTRGEVEIPPRLWNRLLEENKGDSIRISTAIFQEGVWKRYAPFAIRIADDPIDSHLVYRKIAPGYEVYSKMGIYQRTLASYREKALIENTLLPGRCVNCHSFPANNPEKMSFHIRGEGGGTVLKEKNAVHLLNMKTEEMLSSCVYPYWHPSENYIAFSINKTQQSFHSRQNKRIEVYDLESDLVIYDVKKGEIKTSPVFFQTPEFETFPAFSADGNTLYYCSAQAGEIPYEYENIRYNLCSLSFDSEKGTFGSRVDTLLSASAIGKSILFPRPSSDGRYLLLTLADYGTFPIWHKESDLALYDLQNRTWRYLDEVNSRDVDSYHSWSSNARWFVFSSRRGDALYTRPYIAHIDEQGNVGKPFLLPQKRVRDYYLHSLYSYNIPEFVNGPVNLDYNKVEEFSTKREVKRVKFNN